MKFTNVYSIDLFYDSFQDFDDVLFIHVQLYFLLFLWLSIFIIIIVIIFKLEQW
jgi:hypothetical protein